MPPAPTTASRFGPRWPMWVGLAALLPVTAWIAYGLVHSKRATPMADMPIAAPKSPALVPVRHLEAPTPPPVTRPDVAPANEAAPAARTTAPDSTPTSADEEPQTAAELAASIAAREQAAEHNNHDAVASPAPPAMSSPGRTLSLSDL